MAFLDKAGKFAEVHPVTVAVGVFAVGAVFLLLFNRGSTAGASQGDSGSTAAYYQAQAQDDEAGDAVQIAQIDAQASTTQTLIGGQTSIANNSIWAGTDLAETQSSNAAAVAVAPYATENNLISTLGSVASLPGTTETSTSNQGGSLFGLIGGSSSTTTSVVPNPAAVEASGDLSALLGSLGTQSGGTFGTSINSGGFNH